MKSGIGRILSYSRYLTLGLMDASLTSLSVLTATYLAGITNGIEVVKLALSVGVGVAASNFSGGYLAEETETIKERQKVEKAMGLERGGLRHTMVEANLKRGAKERALVNSISGFAGILLSTSPMLFIPYPLSFYYGTMIALGLLILLGVYIARIVHRNIFKSALRVVGIAALVMAINLALSRI